jgi:hypothetical protein
MIIETRTRAYDQKIAIYADLFPSASQKWALIGVAANGEDARLFIQRFPRQRGTPRLR